MGGCNGGLAWIVWINQRVDDPKIFNHMLRYTSPNHNSSIIYPPINSESIHNLPIYLGAEVLPGLRLTDCHQAPSARFIHLEGRPIGPTPILSLERLEGDKILNTEMRGAVKCIVARWLTAHRGKSKLLPEVL